MLFSKTIASLKNLLNSINLDQKHPASISDIGDYLENFTYALRFTENLGYSVQRFTQVRGDLLDPAGGKIKHVLRSLPPLDVRKSAGQCLKWSHYLAPIFQRELQCNAWVTIGQIWKEERFVYNPTWQELRKWGKSGIQPGDLSRTQGLNLHAWITLESGEIIDLTYPTSLAIFVGGNLAQYEGLIVWGRDPHVIENHRYFPMAAGEDIVGAIGSKSFISLLAKNFDDLHSYPSLVAVLP